MDNVKAKLIFLLRNTPSSVGTDHFTVASADPGEGTVTAKYVTPVDGQKNDLLWVTTTGYTQPSTMHVADARTFIDEDKAAGDYEMTKLR